MLDLEFRKHPSIRFSQNLTAVEGTRVSHAKADSTSKETWAALSQASVCGCVVVDGRHSAFGLKGHSTETFFSKLGTWGSLSTNHFSGGSLFKFMPIWVWVKIKPFGDRRFLSMRPILGGDQLFCPARHLRQLRHAVQLEARDSRPHLLLPGRLALADQIISEGWVGLQKAKLFEM